jgi:glutathione S-transferase
LDPILVCASNLSPFGARIRIASIENDLPIIFEKPPGEPGSSERIAITPLAKFPVLVDGEKRIVESLAILEYLQDRFSDRAHILPDNSFERAVARSIAYSVDNYVFPALAPVYGHLMSGAQDRATAENLFGVLGEAFASSSRLFIGKEFAVGNDMSIADIAMASLATVTDTLAAAMDAESPLLADARLRIWWRRTSATVAVTSARDVFHAAFAASS